MNGSVLGLDRGGMIPFVPPPDPILPLDRSQLRPGLRVAVGLSGGADSVALLLALHEQRASAGLVVHAAHLHHGLRGAEADEDLSFCRDLAMRLDVPFHEAQVDTGDAALADTASGKPAETVEEAARRLRYGWFRELLAAGRVDSVATAHTRDDQAETVLARFLRGAWTEGLGGIHPVVNFPEGPVIRPLLEAARPEVEAYLNALGQSWREDSTNRQLTFTRNRIRHELLPELETWNPRLRDHLAHMAELARDEEAWWASELARLTPALILPGRPVRGGGRAAAGGLALDRARFAELPTALQRRLLRHAAGLLGANLDFEATESLRALALTGRAGQKHETEGGLRGERTHRELQLSVGISNSGDGDTFVPQAIEIPGEIVVPGLGLRLRVEAEAVPPETPEFSQATLRPWKPGDRVRLRHTSAPRKVKEVLERLHVSGSDRTGWPVLEVAGRIVWMRGVEVEPEPGIRVQVQPMV